MNFLREGFVIDADFLLFLPVIILKSFIILSVVITPISLNREKIKSKEKKPKLVKTVHVKTLIVNPNQILSLQKHRKRNETWFFLTPGYVQVGKNKTVHVSASFGVAELLPDMPTKDSIKRADQALYEAKKAGRNLVRVWQHAEMPN